jgi:hypothetical protein
MPETSGMWLILDQEYGAKCGEKVQLREKQKKKCDPFLRVSGSPWHLQAIR